MPRAQRQRLSILSASLVLFASWPALAQNAEGRAKGLMDDAMDQDYLATNFKAAEAKLQTASRVCGEKDCTPATIAKIRRALGVVYAGGMNRHTDAVEMFKEMLRLDPKLDLDANFTTDEIKKAFDEAKAATAPAAPPKRELAVVKETPWTEQTVGTPIPVFVELPEGVEASKVTVRYKRADADGWRELALSKHGSGFGGYIPCAAVAKTGSVQYFTTAFDSNLDRVASGGSSKEPRTVTLKDALAGRQPQLPDETPPSACPRAEEKLSCETNDDCPGAMACVDLACVEESSIEVPKDPRAHVKDNWLTLQFSPDLMLVKSTRGVCSAASQEDGQFSCFFGDGSQYTGTPNDTGNSTNGGMGIGSMRVLVGFDRVFAKRITAGARLGFAFLGHPAREGTDKKTFFPIHVELRGAFFFAQDPFMKPGVRPYAFLGGGVADFSARVNTEVQQEGAQVGSIDTFTLDVHQKGGMFWAGGGLGLQYAVNDRMAMVIEVGARQAFPTSATIIAPSLGATFGL